MEQLSLHAGEPTNAERLKLAEQFERAFGMPHPPMEHWGRKWRDDADPASFLIEIHDDSSGTRPKSAPFAFDFSTVHGSGLSSKVYALPEKQSQFLLSRHGLLLWFSAGAGVDVEGASCLVLTDLFLAAAPNPKYESFKEYLHPFMENYFRTSGRFAPDPTQAAPLKAYSESIHVIHALRSSPARVIETNPRWLYFSLAAANKLENLGFAFYSRSLAIVSTERTYKINLEVSELLHKCLRYDPDNLPQEYKAKRDEGDRMCALAARGNKRLEDIVRKAIDGRGKVDPWADKRKPHLERFADLRTENPDAVTLIGEVTRVKIDMDDKEAEQDLLRDSLPVLEDFLLSYTPHAVAANAAVSPNIKKEYAQKFDSSSSMISDDDIDWLLLRSAERDESSALPCLGVFDKAYDQSLDCSVISTATGAPDSDGKTPIRIIMDLRGRYMCFEGTRFHARTNPRDGLMYRWELAKGVPANFAEHEDGIRNLLVQALLRHSHEKEIGEKCRITIHNGVVGPEWLVDRERRIYIEGLTVDERPFASQDFLAGGALNPDAGERFEFRLHSGAYALDCAVERGMSDGRSIWRILRVSLPWRFRGGRESLLAALPRALGVLFGPGVAIDMNETLPNTVIMGEKPESSFMVSAISADDPALPSTFFKRWNGTRRMPEQAILIGKTRIVPLGPVLPGSDLYEFVLDRNGVFLKFFAKYQPVTFGENNNALIWSVTDMDTFVHDPDAMPQSEISDAIESALVATGIPDDSGLPGDSRIAVRLPEALRGTFLLSSRTLAQWPVFPEQSVSLNLPVHQHNSRERSPLYPESGDEVWFHITRGDAYILFKASWVGASPANGRTTWRVGEMISWPGFDRKAVDSLRKAIAPALRLASRDIIGEETPVAVEFTADAVRLHKGFLVIDERLLPKGENHNLSTNTGFTRHPVAYDRDNDATFAYRDRYGYDRRENTPQDGVYSYVLRWRNRTFRVAICERDKYCPAFTVIIPANLFHEKETVANFVLSAFDAFRNSDRRDDYSERIHPDSVFSEYTFGFGSPVFVSASEPGATIIARTEKMNRKFWPPEGNAFPPETPIFMRMELAGRYVECEAAYRFVDASRPDAIEWTVHHAVVPGRMISDFRSVWRDNKIIHASRAPWLSSKAFTLGLEEFTHLAIPGVKTALIRPFKARVGMSTPGESYLRVNP